MAFSSFLRTRRPGDLLQELTNTTKAPGKPNGVLLLEGRGKIVPITVILFERPAMILHHVARIGRIGVDDLVDTTLGEASSANDIGNMDALHPIEPLRFDVGINGYGNAINNHAFAPSVAIPFSLFSRFNVSAAPAYNLVHRLRDREE
jgi:hypothetical protein